MVEFTQYTDIPDDNEIYHDPVTQTSTHVFVASSTSGKTVLIMALWEKLFMNTHITVAMIGNPRAVSNIPLWRAKEEGKCVTIIEGFSPELLTVVVYIARKTFPTYHFCIILDDILTARSSIMVDELLMSLRNVNISSMLSIQYAKKISPAQRGNGLNLYLGKANSPEARDGIIKMFVSKTFSDQQYQSLTSNYGFLHKNQHDDTPWTGIRLSEHRVARLMGRTLNEDSSSSDSEGEKD
jgi:hypothetical protein